MSKFTMFITAACVLFLIKLRWAKNKSLYSITTFLVSTERRAPPDENERGCALLEGKY